MARIAVLVLDMNIAAGTPLPATSPMKKASRPSAVGQDVREANRQEHPVDRPAPAMRLGQIEEAAPRRLINVGVDVLHRVTAGRVDQYGLVGEPPIAIA